MLTGEHVILGTPQYMAPEQIEGRDADARTDLFAFGCVLYELLTGQKAFEGKTPSSVMAAILATEPRPLRELQPVTPASVERIVKRCLAKDPDDRWQTARDLRADLDWIATAAAAPESAPQGVSTAKRGRPWKIATVSLAALTVLLTMALWAIRTPSETLSAPIRACWPTRRSIPPVWLTSR
jgi:eukaryotic-like serine/threonine-protein kinase